MVEIITDNLAQNFISSPVISKATGCVKYVPEKKKLTPTASLFYRETGTGGKDCVTNRKVTDFLPSSKEKGILFFNDLGAKSEKWNGHFLKWKGSAEMVCWFNTDLINENLNVGEIKGHLINLMPDEILPSQYILKGRVWIENIMPKGEDPFKKCKLNVEKFQYLTHPYDHFYAKISFIVFTQKGCPTTITLDPALC